jgi:hypothetical protein
MKLGEIGWRSKVERAKLSENSEIGEVYASKENKRYEK